MSFFYFLAAFLLINRLSKSLKFSPDSAKWQSLFSFSQWGVLIAYLVLQIYLNGIIIGFLGSALLLGLVLFINRQEDFKDFRFFTGAHYPLIAIGFISVLTHFVAPDFYNKYSDYFQLAVLAAFMWIFGKWATTKKQREELKMASLRNAELDRMVAIRTGELTKQKEELERTVDQLKTTQEQLIQSEKLASLGELTAGIAHEIQNPLNFVNNFSEVNIELLDEMEQELIDGDSQEALAIAQDIKQNLEKIRHHGKRADGIVKGMLQHSRASSTTKESTDINKLADEYLRLAYHGLRAKDKSFNAELVTHFAEDLPIVEAVPQDIGRVLLNLFTNAFYATQQKQKTAGPGYRPEVTVTTATENGKVVIKVKDNGTGIPEDIKDKILQPFFTTKPTGEGTGLGLSLSYDIVVKGHGGNINIQSEQDKGSEFSITLPLSAKA